jgi:large subunit ribosomal protein L10
MKTDYKIDVNKRAVKKKTEQVTKTIEEMGKSPTVALINLRYLPDSLLQKVRQKLREDGGQVRILKKPVIERVLQSDPKLSSLVSECDKPMGLIFTPRSPFELHQFFKTNKKKRAAKAGDIAPFEIIVPEGETDLPPGPALSELKAAGINVQIKGGKIVVAKDSVVAKSGDKITDAKAKGLQKLGIMPFDVEVNYILGYDGKYIYGSDLFAISETISDDLHASIFDAFNLSINASYPTSANADLLLTDALHQSMNIALNGDLYSSISIEQLLASAFRQGAALSGLEGTAPPPKELKPDKQVSKIDSAAVNEEKAEEKAEVKEPAGDAPAKPEPEAKTEAEKPEEKKEIKAEEKTEVKK